MQRFGNGVRVLILVTAALVTACSGGLEESVDEQRIDGILAGTITRNNVPYAMVAIASNGRFVAVEDEHADRRFYSGTFTHNDGILSATNITIYEINDANGTSFDHVGDDRETGADFQNVTVTAAGWTGNIVGAGSGTSTFTLTYDRDLDALNSDIDFIADTWRFDNASFVSSLFVDSSGTTGTTSSFNGNPFACGSNGSASVVNPRFNIYAWQTTPSGASCSSTAPLTGLAFLTADGQTLAILLAGADHFHFLPYVRQ